MLGDFPINQNGEKFKVTISSRPLVGGKKFEIHRGDFPLDYSYADLEGEHCYIFETLRLKINVFFKPGDKKKNLYLLVEDAK